MSREKQIDIIIDLLTEFDEMGFVPTTSVPNPDAYAIKWREQLTNALIEYRKQSEGEWLDIDICAEDMYCSVCGGIAPVDCEKEEFYKSNFCPNCGAKMKGGAEYCL